MPFAKDSKIKWLLMKVNYSFEYIMKLTRDENYPTPKHHTKTNTYPLLKLFAQKYNLLL